MSENRQPSGHIPGVLRQWVGESTGIGGVSNYSKGEFIYQDYVHDDYGAGTGIGIAPGALQITTLWGLLPPAGSYRYPANFKRYASNCADLVQLRIAADEHNIYFLALLGALTVPDSTVIGIAFDTGGSDPSTCKGYSWPFEAHVTTPGTSHVLTLWGTGGAWDETDLKSVGGKVAVSTEHNFIEASIPKDLLGTLRFWCFAATGLWDAKANTWLEVKAKRDDYYAGGGNSESPRVFNLAFRGGESGAWFEDRQANTLRSGDVAKRTGTVPGDIHMPAQYIDLENPSDTPPQLPAGYYQRIYTASASPGEGVSENGVLARGRTGVQFLDQFLGKYQPYAIYVPKTYDGVLLFLHGGLSNHTAPMAYWPMLEQLGDEGGNIIVSPLGRGSSAGWIDYSYLDALEALEDVIDRYQPNPDRVFVGGVSMGGQGTSRFVTTRPDLFAACVQIVSGETRPPDNPRLEVSTNIGSTVDLYENVRHIPTLFVLGGKDTSGNTEFSIARIERLKAMGYMYRQDWHPLWGHMDFVKTRNFIRERDWLKGKKLVRNPPHVTFKICEGWWRPDVSPKLVFDHAYWVSGLRARDNSSGLKSFGMVDAVSHAAGGSEPELRHYSYSSPGPPSRHLVDGQDYIWPGKTLEQYNGFTCSLENLKTVTFSTRAMGLDLSNAVRFKVESDGPTQLRLTGKWPEVQVSLDSQVSDRWQRDDAGIQIEIPIGSHLFTVNRR